MITLKSVSAVVIVCLLSTTASAQDASEREILKQYCTGDYLAHCSEFAPDSSDVKECFRAKSKLMSVKCSAAISFYQQKQSGIRQVNLAR